MKIDGSDIEITEATVYRPQPGDILLFSVDTQNPETFHAVRQLLEGTFAVNGVDIVVYNDAVQFKGVVQP